MLNDSPHRRTRRVGVGCALQHESPLGRAVGDQGIGIKLELDEGLPKRLLGSVTVPPNQNVGPVAETGNEPSVGRTTVQVRLRAEPGALDTGSSSGSSCPLHPLS